MVVNALLWIDFGLIAGIVAKFLGQERETVDAAGILGTAVLGNAGALLGGFLSSRLFGWDVNSFSFAGFAVAVVGGFVLLFLYHLVIGARRTARM
jgi:uncharacterized membrane protein YeaQ/YmgE (transglycosylase-associated protein family)